MWNTVSTIVYSACGWLMTLVVVWISDDFQNAGYLALAMSITNFFTYVAAYNVRAYQVSDIEGEFSDSIYIANRAVTCSGAFILCIVFVVAAGYTREQGYIIICYMGYRAVEAFIDVLHGITHKHMRLDYAAKSSIARGLLTLTGFTVIGWFFGLMQAIPAMLIITILIGVFYDIPKARSLTVFETIKIKEIGLLLKRCFPLMLVMLIFTFFASYNRYTIERLLGTQQLGSFASATTPAVALSLIVTFAFAPLVSVLSNCKKNKDIKKLKKIAILTCLSITSFTGVAVIAAKLLGQWGLEILFGEKIIPYAYLLPGAVAATGCMALLWFMNIVFSAIRDIKGLFIGSLAGAVVCFAATGLFINTYGLSGANYALITCQGVAFICLFGKLIWNIKNMKPELKNENNHD